MCQPFMFPSISSIFFSARSIWLWLFFSCFVLFLCWLGGCGSYLFIRRVPDISHTPRIISSLVEIPQNGIQHGSFLEVPQKCPNLSCFPLFLPSSLQQEAFDCDCFFHVLSCFCAGWVVVAATFLFEGFRTSHIPLQQFLPRWRSHRMAFNMALSWKCPQNVPTFHVSLYFFHLLFSKKHLVVIVFFMFCPVSVLVGWLWQLLVYSKGSGHLTYP